MSALPGASAGANPLPSPGGRVLGGAGAEQTERPVPVPGAPGSPGGSVLPPLKLLCPPLLPLSPLTPTHHRLPSPPGTASQCRPPHRPPTPDFLPCGASWACVPHPPTPLGCRCHLLDDNAPEHGPAPHSDLAPSVYRTLTSHLPATPKPRSALIVRSWTRSHAKSTPCQAFHNPADHTHCSAASTPRPPHI